MRLLFGVFIGALVMAWLKLGTPDGGVSGLARPATPTPAAVTLHEQRFFQGTPLCPQGCLSLHEWQPLVQNETLLRGLALAYQYNPPWRTKAQVAVARGTRVVEGTLPPGTGGQYDPSKRLITISPEFVQDRADVLAAALAHEVVHAASTARPSDTRAGAASCMNEEITAYSWEAATYAAIYDPEPQTPIGQDREQLVLEWQEHRLQQRVLLSTTYQRECFDGQILPNP